MYEQVELIRPDTGETVDTVIINHNDTVEELVHQIVEGYDEFLPSDEVIIRGPSGDTHLSWRDRFRDN